MKNKDFETAVENLQDLFASLNKRGVLTQLEVMGFNDCQRKIISYYNVLTGNTEVKLPWNNPEFIQAWDYWKTYRKQQHNFHYKPIGEKEALNDLYEMSKGDHSEAIKLIHHAIKKTWQGIFPIKAETPKKTYVKTPSHKPVNNTPRPLTKTGLVK